MEQKIGHYSFIVGVVLALVLGLAGQYLGAAQAWLISLLVVLGLVVGFINVTGKETKEFLTVVTILAVVLYVSGGTASISSVKFGVVDLGTYLAGVLTYAMAFIVPAVIVVALKQIYQLGKYT